jgi:hypothetical protein
MEILNYENSKAPFPLFATALAAVLFGLPMSSHAADTYGEPMYRLT